MSNDLFDKKIKEKLEAVQRPVSKSLWEKIQKQLVVPWYFDFWRRFGLPIYSALITLLLFYAIKEKFNFENQIQLLNDKISTIKQVKPITQVQTIVHQDTVFIEKRIYIVDRTSNENRLPNEATKPKITTEKNDIIGNKTTDVLTKNEHKITEITTPKIEAKTENSTKNSVTEKPKEEIELVSSQTTVKDSAKKTETYKPIDKPTEIHKKTFKMPDFDARIGIVTGISTDKTLALGPKIDFALGQNLRFSIGAIFNNYPEKEFSSIKDFNLQTGRNFLELYSTQIPQNYDAIGDIYIKTTMLEMPLSLDYYVPIKPQFDLLFSLGTHVDLRLYRTVKFDSFYNGNATAFNYSSQEKQNIWHNMVFGAGVQYRKKRVALQLVPSYIYNFREVDYIDAGGAFRINGAVFLYLKK